MKLGSHLMKSESKNARGNPIFKAIINTSLNLDSFITKQLSMESLFFEFFDSARVTHKASVNKKKEAHTHNQVRSE